MKQVKKLVVMTAVVGFVAAACGGSSGGNTGSSPGTARPEEGRRAEPRAAR